MSSVYFTYGCKTWIEHFHFHRELFFSLGCSAASLILIFIGRIINPLDIRSLKDGTITLSRNVGHQSSINAVLYSRRTRKSNAPLRKPNNLQFISI